MTILETRRDGSELLPGPDSTYDLIICQHEALVVHEYYDSPQMRLHACLHLVTNSPLLGRVIDNARALELDGMYCALSRCTAGNPDSILNAVAKRCRDWGVHIFVSSTTKKTLAPDMLYSVVTDYGQGQALAEHFPDRQARRESLIKRAGQFMPEPALADEQHLVTLLETFLAPTSIALTESVLHAATGTYRPAGDLPSVH